LNDDFGSIVLGIREGRHIFNNLKKCITYVLSSNVPEIGINLYLKIIVPFLVFILAKWPLGIETISILLIDLGTDITPTVALAYEEPEDHIMTCKPRSNDDHLLTWRVMIIAYFTIGVF
jgi:sodium/potassium-transporting ATPase subunit alpha